MKMKRSLLFVVFSIATSVFGQTTIVLQPGPVEGKDARINSLETYGSGSADELPVEAWTFLGTPGIDRALIEFDLSAIPASASITSANLTLYGTVGSGSGGHSTLSGSNEFYVRRVIEPWDEMSVSYAAQPAATTLNEIIAPASTSSDEDYNIDVTVLVQDMVDDPSGSFGFKLQEVTESYYRRINFWSHDSCYYNGHMYNDATGAC